MWADDAQLDSRPRVVGPTAAISSSDNLTPKAHP